MTTQEIAAYYKNLLILQYGGKPKASATIQAVANIAVLPTTSVQTVSFLPAPTSGQFKLVYGLLETSALNWNDSAATIQSALQALSGLSSVLVTGSIASVLTITFEGVTPIATILTTDANTLLATATPVVITIEETDVTLPIMIQNAFNLIGDSIAQGVQLDVLGKYAGVTRNGYTFTGAITLNDDEFLQFMRMAILKNNSGSSLATIQLLLNTYFAGSILVFDYANMRLGYFMDSSIGSKDLAEMFIVQGMLPKPMGVQLAITVYNPTIDNFFGFRTYSLPGFNVSPFNTYSSYDMDSPWLSYANGLY